MSPSPLAWAFHSPARFIAVILAALALLVAAFWLGLRGGDGGVERHAGQHRPVAETGIRASSPGAEPHTDEHGESFGPAARRTVDQFLTHYLAPTNHEELAQLQALSTTELWSGLQVADPSNMPAGPVKRIEETSGGAFSAAFTVELPGSSLTVDVVASPEGPRVASVEPETP